MKQLPIAKPFIGEEEVEAVAEVLRSGWITQGPKVKAFEEAFAQTVQSSHACAVSSGTTALHLALLAVGVKPGDVVITVYIATANAVRYCGAEPVFVDIDLETFNMSSDSLEEFLSDRCELRDGQIFYLKAQDLKKADSPLMQLEEKYIGRVAAVLVVHQIGIPCQIKKIVGICQEFKLPVVEDAACAIGSKVSVDNGQSWESIGQPHGDIACFSFHPRKVLTTGEGGMVTTQNPEYDQMFRLLRQHGMSVPDLTRHKAEKVIFEDYDAMGFNYRMTDMQAAIGLVQLTRLEDMMKHRQEIARCYRDLFAEIAWLRLPIIPSDVQTNWQSFAVLMDECAPISQEGLMQGLLDQGIATRPAVMNAHQELPYSHVSWDLPNSKKAREQGVLFPMFEGMGKDDCRRVFEAIQGCI